MEPLASGRNVLFWMGVHFVGGNTLGWKQKWAQKVFAAALGSTFVAIATLHIITFLRVGFNNVTDFFYVLLQFVMTIQISSSFITICLFRKSVSSWLNCWKHRFVPFWFDYLNSFHAKSKWWRILWVLIRVLICMGVVLFFLCTHQIQYKSSFFLSLFSVWLGWN